MIEQIFKCSTCSEEFNWVAKYLLFFGSFLFLITSWTLPIQFLWILLQSIFVAFKTKRIFARNLAILSARIHGFGYRRNNVQKKYAEIPINCRGACTQDMSTHSTLAYCTLLRLKLNSCQVIAQRSSHIKSHAIVSTQSFNRFQRLTKTIMENIIDFDSVNCLCLTDL